MSEPTKEYWEQMRAHVDEGGKLDHRNAVDLLNRAEKAEAEARRWQENHKGVVASKRKAQAKTEEFRVAAKKAEATADEAVRLLKKALPIVKGALPSPAAWPSLYRVDRRFVDEIRAFLEARK